MLGIGLKPREGLNLLFISAKSLFFFFSSFPQKCIHIECYCGVGVLKHCDLEDA